MVITIHANNPVIPVVVLNSIPAANLRGLCKNPEAAWQKLHMGDSRLLATKYGLGSRGFHARIVRLNVHFLYLAVFDQQRISLAAWLAENGRRVK